MKVIGLIGGMSWESSAEYYRVINDAVKARLGGLHSARLLMYSVDFAEIEAMQMRGAWDDAAAILVNAAQRLERGGAEFILLCTNTMHKVAAAIEAAITIPFIHIADPTAAQITAQNISTIGLLGTKFTMEQAFYVGRLRDKYGLEVVIPNAEERQLVHDIIYQELCLGKILDTSRGHYRHIMQNLVAQGAQGIILGCTEITLLVGQADSPVPVFDTTALHAHAAVDLALAD